MGENENSTLKKFMKEFKEFMFWKAMKKFGKVDSYPIDEEMWEAYLESMRQDLLKRLNEGDPKNWKEFLYRYLRICQGQIKKQMENITDEEKKKLLTNEIEIYNKLIKELSLNGKES